MSVSDPVVTYACVLEWQVPGGAVRLADGGVVKFDSGGGVAAFESEHPIFGTLVEMDEFETAIGGSVEGGTLSFAPNLAADVADWWRTDLENTPLRLWFGQVDPADKVTLINPELVADWLVDAPRREQGEGTDLLSIDFMTTQDKLFQIRQGNVCSDTFHRSIWAGERGFENCTDSQQFFAWGTASPPGSGSSAASGGGGGGNGGGGGFDSLNVNFQ